MERKGSLSNSLKDHCIRDSSATTHHHHQRLNMIKVGSSLIGSYPSHAEDYLSGVSWPPRSYSCSFCKREFGSAQALGGHMNVHRRDRARLRQSSPPLLPAKAEKADSSGGQHPLLGLNLNHNPQSNSNNPSPNFSSSPLSSPPHFTRALPTSISRRPPPPAFSSTLPSMNFPPAGEVGWARKCLVTRVGEADCGWTTQGFGKDTKIVRLGMQVDVLNNFKEDEVDLELRLGYSN